MTLIKNFINKILKKFGLRISKINVSDELIKIYKYKDYNDYKETQILYNKKKLHHVWADDASLENISNFLRQNITKENIKGICHGSRNGFEQSFFNRSILNSHVIGTDISETAKNFKDSEIWDFHNVKSDWINYFDFVYTNSLDQSYDPKLALTVWLDQVITGGFIIIEHSDQHGVRSSGKMDPFGAEANFMPYLLTDWFGHSISLSIIKSIKKNKNDAPVWFFILKKVK